MNPAEHTEHTNRVPLTGIPVGSLGVPPMSGPSVPEYQRPLEAHPREEEYPPHPFEIFAWYDTVAGKTKYQVAPGAFTVNEYYFDSDIYDDTGQVFTGRSEECDVKLGVPVGPSLGIGPSSPSAEIASGDDYGVWIVIEITAGSSASVGGQGNAFFLWQREVPVVVASDNAPEKTDASALGPDSPYSNFHAFYLGKISVNSSGIPEVTQYRKSDIEWQGAAWFQPRIVSGDEPNDIRAGTDGGALYVAPEEEP